jgi:hypothetical protein
MIRVKRSAEMPLGKIYYLAFLLSIVFSVWMTGRAGSLVNPDGICYLLSAQSLGENTLAQVMHLCAQSQWPFFSWLIHLVVRGVHVSYPVAAYFLDGVFSTLSVLMFMAIVQVLGGKRLSLVLAAATILLAHEFNAVREYIIRDHGFWAFYLISIYLWILYCQQPKWTLSLTWGVSLVVATLFRIEGALFLLLVPLSVFFLNTYTVKQRLQLYLQANSVVFFLLLSFCLVLLAYPALLQGKLGRLPELSQQIQHGIALAYTHYQTARGQLAHYVLTKDSLRQASVVFFVMMVGWYVVSVLANLSYAYGFLVLYAWVKKIRLPQHGRLALIAYLLINVGITSLFLLQRFFLSKRYLIALSLVLMLWVPFALEKLIQQRNVRGNKIILFVLMLSIGVSSIGGLFEFGASKVYIQEAGGWLALETPPHAKIYSNDYQVLYYSQHFNQDLFSVLARFSALQPLASDEWRHYDYLALRLNIKDQDERRKRLDHFIAQFTDPPLKTFSNQRGDKVAIYRVQKKEV